MPGRKADRIDGMTIGRRISEWESWTLLEVGFGVGFWAGIEYEDSRRICKPGLVMYDTAELAYTCY